MLEVVLGVFLLAGMVLTIRYYPAAQPIDLKKNDLQKQVQQLSREVQQLEQEQACQPWSCTATVTPSAMYSGSTRSD